MKRGHAGVVAAAVLATIATAARARAHGEPCTSAGGEDTCPQGEACTVQDGSPGVCAAPPCSSGLDCVPPLVHCDLARTPPTCIQCRDDLECATPRTCELDPRSALSNLCVECSPGRVACDHADAGHRCLFSKGVCGCGRDDDCAAGLVCGRRSTCETAGLTDGGDAADPNGEDPLRRAAEGGGAAAVDELVAGGGCATVTTTSGPAPFAAILGVSLLARIVRRGRRAR